VSFMQCCVDNGSAFRNECYRHRVHRIVGETTRRGKTTRRHQSTPLRDLRRGSQCRAERTRRRFPAIVDCVTSSLFSRRLSTPRVTTATIRKNLKTCEPPDVLRSSSTSPSTAQATASARASIAPTVEVIVLWCCAANDEHVGALESASSFGSRFCKISGCQPLVENFNSFVLKPILYEDRSRFIVKADYH
jgi:hypothetical protein